MGWFDDLKNVNIGGGGINLNPFASSIYSGKGTPWGEGPQDPYQAKNTFKAFDPNDYKGFDSSGLAAALRQGIGANTANATSRLQGQLQGSGGGGADAVSGLAQLQGQQGQAENTLNAQLSRQDWQDRLGQWQDKMQADQNHENNLANADAARYGRDVEGRAAPWKALGQVAGAAAGSVGGPIGAAAGKKVADSLFG